MSKKDQERMFGGWTWEELDTLEGLLEYACNWESLDPREVIVRELAGDAWSEAFAKRRRESNE